MRQRTSWTGYQQGATSLWATIWRILSWPGPGLDCRSGRSAGRRPTWTKCPCPSLISAESCGCWTGPGRPGCWRITATPLPIWTIWSGRWTEGSSGPLWRDSPPVSWASMTRGASVCWRCCPPTAAGAWERSSSGRPSTWLWSGGRSPSARSLTGTRRPCPSSESWAWRSPKPPSSGSWGAAVDKVDSLSQKCKHFFEGDAGRCIALRRGKVRTAHPSLTAGHRSVPLPLLSQTNLLRRALFGSPTRTFAA